VSRTIAAVFKTQMTGDLISKWSINALYTFRDLSHHAPSLSLNLSSYISQILFPIPISHISLLSFPTLTMAATTAPTTSPSTSEGRTTILVTIRVSPTNVDEFLTGLKISYSGCVSEPELLFFEVFQEQDDPGCFHLFEVWARNRKWFETVGWLFTTRCSVLLRRQ